MDLTGTIMRQVVVDDVSDLRRIPPGCSRYLLCVFVFMDDDEVLDALPDGLLYDPRREAVYAPTAGDLARGVLACIRHLGRPGGREVVALRRIADITPP